MERKTGKSGERENLIRDVMDERRVKRKEKNSSPKFQQSDVCTYAILTKV